MVEFKVELNESLNEQIEIHLSFKNKSESDKDKIWIDHQFLLKLGKKYDDLMKRYYNNEISYPILNLNKDFIEVNKNESSDEYLRICENKDYESNILEKFTYEVSDYKDFIMDTDEFNHFIVDILGYKNENSDEEYISNLEFLEDNLFSSFSRVLKVKYDINEGVDISNTYPSLKFIYKSYKELEHLKDLHINKELFNKICKNINSVSGIYFEIYDNDKLLEEKYVSFDEYQFKEINLSMDNDKLLVKKESVFDFLLELTEGYSYENIINHLSSRNDFIVNTLYNYSYNSTDYLNDFVEKNENCMFKFFIYIVGIWFYVVYLKIVFGL